jgi:hypothetical protein
MLAKRPKKILNIAKLSTLVELDAKRAEINTPIWEKTSNVLGPYLLYKKAIGSDPNPKQKLLMLKINPRDEALRL